VNSNGTKQNLINLRLMVFVDCSMPPISRSRTKRCESITHRYSRDYWWIIRRTRE